MNIVFVSNYFNHHQRALCDALQELTGGNFCFVETIPMRQERRELGYGEDSLPEYVLTAYADPRARERSLERILLADAVIAGSAPEAYLKARIRAGKLIFRYAERPLKQGMQWGKYPIRLLRWHLRNPAGKPIYLLAASAYAPGDYSRFGLFRHRAYRWGYFPAVKPYDRLPGKEEHSILWAGRFLDWKHPEAALLAARNLKDAGIPFDIVCDPEMAIYKQFEILPAADMKAMAGNPEQLERLQTKGKAAAEAGFSHGKYEGDELQLPAVWVVEADGTLSYVKYGEAVADIPTPDELIAML